MPIPGMVIVLTATPLLDWEAAQPGETMVPLDSVEQVKLLNVRPSMLRVGLGLMGLAWIASGAIRATAVNKSDFENCIRIISPN